MKSTAKNIYNELSKISFDNNDLKDTWSDIDAINTYVNKALSDNQRGSIAYYISPTSFSIFDKKGMLSLAEEICARETQDGMILNDHYTLERHTNTPKLTKPFLGVSNTESVLLNQTNSTEGGSHWVSWALLPKEYKTISGQIIKHEKYRVYFFDSFGHWKFPENLKKCITEGAEFSEKVNEGSKNEKTIHRKLLPFCPKEEIDFIDTSNLTGQQMNRSDCGWWAVYYVLMTIYEGEIDFLNEIKGRKLSAVPLRQIMNLEENTPNQPKASLQSEGGSGKKEPHLKLIHKTIV